MQMSFNSSLNQQFKHDSLYKFWTRSQGLWFSKLAKVTVRLLDEQELLAICQIHPLKQPEFGVKMSWEYQTQAKLAAAGQMLWCVDANQFGLVFTNKGIANDSQPGIYHYQILSNHILVTTDGNLEEITTLEGV